MRYREIVEKSVRMGAKDLAKTDLAGVFVGFEFEIATALKQGTPSREEAFEQWEMDNYRMTEEEWFRYVIGNAANLIARYGATPKYGFASVQQVHDTLYAGKEDDEKVDEFLVMPRTTDKEKSLFITKASLYLNEGEPLENIKYRIQRALSSDLLDVLVQTTIRELSKRRIPPRPTTNEETTSYVLDEDGKVYPTNRLGYEDLDLFNLPDDFDEIVQNGIEDEYQEKFDIAYESGELDIRENSFDARTRLSRDIAAVLPYSVREGDIEQGIGDTVWKLVPDGSIEPTGIELVSPPMEAKASLQALKRVCSMIAEDDDMETNESTGLHVNVSVAHPEKIDLLKLSLLLGEDHILRDWDREGNEYAQKVLADFSKKLEGNPRSVSDAITYLNAEILKKPDHHRVIDFGKLAKGYLEFRATGGAGYEKRVNDVQALISRYVRLIQIASDPMAEREAYLKKLSVWLAKETPTIDWQREFGISPGKAWSILSGHTLDINSLNSSDLFRFFKDQADIIEANPPDKETLAFYRKLVPYLEGYQLNILKKYSSGRYWKMIFGK